MRTAAHWKAKASGTSPEILRDDRILFVILLAHLPVVMFLVPVGFGTDVFAIYSSLLVGILNVAAYLTLRGTPRFGLVAGVLLMTLSAIMIQAELGRIEMHFHIFVALPVLMVYRNWVNIAVAAGVILVHHLAFTALQSSGAGLGEMPIMVFNYGCSWSIAMLHAAFVLCETLVLVYYVRLMNRDQHTTELLSSAIVALTRDRDLTRRIQDDAGSPDVTAFNELIGDFSRLTQDVAQAARELGTVASRLETRMQGANRDASVQQEQSEQAAAAMQAMIQTVCQVAETTRSAAELAAGVNDRAQEGHDLFNRAVRSTADLQWVMTDALSAIRLLASNAKTIGAVVDVIRGITEQTNLLALNADIQAERAGEHGHGFAVVAGQARGLALQTQESTQEIQGITQKIQSDIEASVARTTYGQQKTTETSSDILQVGLALNEILESVTRITAMNDRIASAIDRQSRVTDTLNTSILSISTHSRNLVDQAKTDLDAAPRLQQLAKSLQTRVSAYRR